jgi:hypothetical protein
VYRVLLGNPEGRRPPARTRCGWEDNNGIDLQQVGYGGMDWIDLFQGKDGWQVLANAVVYIRVS